MNKIIKQKVTCHDKDGNPHETPVKELIWRPSVYGILIENGKILLSPQWDGYDLPGGGVEIYETMEEGLEREFWEETGLKVKMNEVIDIRSSFFKFTISEKRAHSIQIFYLCEKVGGEISTKNFDEDEKNYVKKAQWVDLGEIDNLKFYSSVDVVGIIKRAERFMKNKKDN